MCRHGGGMVPSCRAGPCVLSRRGQLGAPLNPHTVTGGASALWYQPQHNKPPSQGGCLLPVPLLPPGPRLPAGTRWAACHGPPAGPPAYLRYACAPDMARLCQLDPSMLLKHRQHLPPAGHLATCLLPCLPPLTHASLASLGLQYPCIPATLVHPHTAPLFLLSYINR